MVADGCCCTLVHPSGGPKQTPGPEAGLLEAGVPVLHAGEQEREQLRPLPWRGVGGGEPGGEACQRSGGPQVPPPSLLGQPLGGRGGGGGNRRGSRQWKH